MKGQNKLVKKILILVMTLGLAITAVSPIKSQASEVEEPELTDNSEVEALPGPTLFSDMPDMEGQGEDQTSRQLAPEADIPESGVSSTEIEFYELNEAGDSYDPVGAVTKEYTNGH